MSTIDESVMEDIIKDVLGEDSTATLTKSRDDARKELEMEVPEFAKEEGKVLYSSLFNKSFSGREHNISVFDKAAWSTAMQNYVPDVSKSYIFQPEATEKLIVGLEHGDRILFTGPTGSGKSSLVQQACAKVGRPFIRINMTGDMESGAFFGQLVVEDGATVWRDGLMTQAVREGAVVLVDEWELCPPEIMMGLQYLLEDDGVLMLKEKPGGERVIPHPDFRLLMGGNTLGQGDESGAHAGTNVQNTATLDRFQTVIELDYLEPKHEQALILATVPDLKPKIAENMVKFAGLLRAGYNQGSVSLTCSPRTLINWARKTVYWGDPVVALKMAFFDKVTASEKGYVNEVVNKVFSQKVK